MFHIIYNFLLSLWGRWRERYNKNNAFWVDTIPLSYSYFKSENLQNSHKNRQPFDLKRDKACEGSKRPAIHHKIIWKSRAGKVKSEQSTINLLRPVFDTYCESLLYDLKIKIFNKKISRLRPTALGLGASGQVNMYVFQMST